MPHVIQFTDCYDDNAKARLAAAIDANLNASMTLNKIKRKKFAAAGLDLVDVLAAGQTVSGIQKVQYNIILANMARRELSQNVYRNGPPFCYFWVPGRTPRQARTLVVSTYTEDLLAQAHRLGLVESVNLLDIPEVLTWAVQLGKLTAEEAEIIEHTQFRSLEFVPLVANLLTNQHEVPHEVKHLGEAPTANGIALRIDNFGNIYTDVLPEEVDFTPGETLLLEKGMEVPCYRQLAEVPKGQLAAVIGSSGYGRQRFIMLTVQGASAEKRLKAKTGCPVISITELLKAQPSMAEIGR